MKFNLPLGEEYILFNGNYSFIGNISLDQYVLPKILLSIFKFTYAQKSSGALVQYVCEKSLLLVAI